MNLLPTLSLAMGSSWVSGINLYASVATLGLLALYVAEFIADKVPVVDSLWDVVHTFVRIPAGGAMP